MDKKVALVTGANRGIGFEICRQLGQTDIQVILTSRNSKNGNLAAEKLLREDISVQFHTLDVSNSNSRVVLRDYIQDQFGQLDILINNAAVYLDRNTPATETALDIIRETFEINFYGPLALCQMFIPLMQKHNYGRIVNVSSGMGALSEMGSGSIAYRTSKTALNAMTQILANETAGKDILINTMCPGWVRTDMGGSNAPRTVEQGAKTAVWLASLPAGGSSGKFFRDNREIKW
jgi:NAD(P)-dependent dehydrogenase (short-subunit alcohol dehydrogenase family)